MYKLFALFISFFISFEADIELFFRSTHAYGSSFGHQSGVSSGRSCKSLFEIKFAESFRDRKSYCAGFCDDNVHGFLLKLQSEHIDLTQAHVLLLLYNSSLTTQTGALNYNSLKPQKARSPEAAPRGWTYHVLVESQGRIYDFDFGLIPEALPAREYFQKMWVGPWGLKYNPLERIMMRSIPASEFLKIYDPANLEGFGELRFAVGGKYPIISAEEYLTQLERK